MLRFLRIRDLALLEDVEVEFDQGLNILTGETGAGKSLLVQAVMLLRGERADAFTVRAGADEMVVEALFGDDNDAREIVLRRTVGKTGRSRGHVGGELTPIAVVATQAATQVDVAGQHEHQTLCDVRRHREVLDSYGVARPLLEQMADRWRKLVEAERALEDVRQSERKRGEREDFLRFGLREMDQAALVEGDEQRLPAERERLRSAVKLTTAARVAEETLVSGDEALAGRLARVERELAAVARIDATLEPVMRTVLEARTLVVEIGRELARYADGLSDDPEALAAVEERVSNLRQLQRKHGTTAQEILQRREEFARELAMLEGASERRAELERSVETHQEAARIAAVALSEAREKAAVRLGRAVEMQLHRLGMPAARFVVVVERQVGGGTLGADAVEFRIAPNPGEGLQPLVRVASGGELSRVMLALRCVLAEADPVPTYVFDEVDAGVSGAVAETIGRLLRDVARRRQVLCVTHLAPVAAMGHAHFVVEKHGARGRTTTRVRRLASGERREELARMLAGAKVTDSARAHADEMLRAVESQ